MPSPEVLYSFILLVKDFRIWQDCVEIKNLLVFVSIFISYESDELLLHLLFCLLPLKNFDTN